MMMGWSALLGLGLLWSVDAEARPSHHHHARPRPRVASRPSTARRPGVAARPGVVTRPGVRVTVGWSPWAIGYRPAPRPGYIWVGGCWSGSLYVPGHWRPSTPPPQSDYVWVDGHWEDDTYIDGYWRIEEIDGMIWVDGEYDDDDYYDGHWEDERGSVIAPAALPEAAAVPAPDSLAVPFGAPDDEEETWEEPLEEEPELHHAPPDRWW